MGIGTTIPAQALDINGNIAIKGQNFLSAFSSGSNVSSVLYIGYGAGNINGNASGENTAVGAMALSSINGSAAGDIAIGGAALELLTSGTGNTVVGYDAGASMTTGGANTLIGNGAGGSITTADGDIYIGASSGAGGNCSNDILIGNSTSCHFLSDWSNGIALGFGATLTANNQMVVGNASADPITDIYLGSGAIASSALIQSVAVHATGADGNSNNEMGANLILDGGTSSGNANGGSIIFQTSPAGSSGSSINSLVQAAQITSSGNMGIGTSLPSALLEIGNQKFDITSAGNVGIGTWLPKSQLDINQGTLTFVEQSQPTKKYVMNSQNIGTPFADDRLVFDSNGTTNGSRFWFNTPSGTVGVSWAVGNAESMALSASSTATKWNLYTDMQIIDSSGTTHDMFKQSNGALGLGTGTSAPVSQLDVSGNMSVGSYAATHAGPTNGIAVSGNVGVGTWAPNNSLQVNGGNVGIGTRNGGALITVGGSCATSAQGQGMCWGTSSNGVTCIGYCTAGTWPNCSTCTCC